MKHLCAHGMPSNQLQNTGQCMPHSKPSFLILSIIAATGLLLAGCSSGPSGPKRHAAFKGTGSPHYAKSSSVPKGGGRYKVGKPYKVAGQWFRPHENTRYNKTGIASWYGAKFHRRKTANGEWFDMNKMTAAHPTLPMPVFARVTNLKTGTSIVVRINDRGPFVANREIDLSKAAAKRLGYFNGGLTRVRVQYIGPAPLEAHAANYYGQSSQPVMTAQARRKRKPVRVAALPRKRRQTNQNYGPTRPRAHANTYGPSQAPAMATNGFYIQAASYSNYDNAIRAKQNLSVLGPVEMTPIKVRGRVFYRVRVGPLNDNSLAQNTLNRIVDAGHSDARIVMK